MCEHPTTKTSERNCVRPLSDLWPLYQGLLRQSSPLTLEWQTLSSPLLDASQSILGNMERRHQDWFNDNAADIRSLIHDEDAARDTPLRYPTTRTLRERFPSICATVLRKLCWMENNWWFQKAAQIHGCANVNDTSSFYDELRGVYGRNCFSLHPVRSNDGALIMNKDMILIGWAEYLQSLLFNVLATDSGSLYDLPTLPIIPKFDDQHSFYTVEKAVLSLKDNKAAGPDYIPADAIKYGGCALYSRLHNFILDCWSAKFLLQQWKNVDIILVFKQKQPYCWLTST